MRLSRDVFRWVMMMILALTLPALAVMRPAAAQEPGTPDIEQLALQAHDQNRRAHSYTAWIGGQLGDPALAVPTIVGDELTRWTLQGINGDEDVRSTDLTRPVLLNFWASWCPPCRLEFPHMVSVALAPEAHNFDVVFVNVWDTEDDALAYLDGFPETIHTVLDANDWLATRAYVNSIPTSLLLDTDGTVLVAHVGIVTPTITAFLDAVAGHPGEGLFVAADHMDDPLEAVLQPVDVESATPITPGKFMSGTIDDEDTQDAYRYEGHAGETLKISLIASAGSELDPYVVLMKADGTHIAENDDIDPGVIQNSALEVTLPEDGTYIIVATRFLEAEGFSAGSYRLVVMTDTTDTSGTEPPEQAQQQEQPPPPDVTLSYGETVSGTLDDTHYEDRWTFAGQRGDLIRLVMNRTVDELGGLDGYMILEGPDGATLIEVDDYNNSVMPALDPFELPADGVYTVVATRFGFANGFSTGEYTLTLEKEGTVSTAAISAQGDSGMTGVHWLSPGELPPGLRWIDYNDPVSGSITRDNVDDWLIFRGHEGDTLTIRMTNSDGDLDPFLILTDANGVELARNDDAEEGSSAAVIGDFVLPTTDSYLIRATRYGFENGPSTGDYALVIETSAEPVGLDTDVEPLAELHERQVVTGSLSLDQARDRYTFEGNAGDWITVAVEPTSGDLNPSLTLYDQDGDEIASNRSWQTFDDGRARIERVQLPADGLYTIDVILEDLTTSGDYRLVVLPAPSRDVDPGAFVPAEGLDVELVLIWSGEADLNLAGSLMPGGEKTASANDFCATVTDTPVERVIYEAGSATPGIYPLFIEYAMNCDGQTEPVDFVLVIAQNGKVVDIISGSLAREGDAYTTWFEYAR
jgi:thiol-disulfide isomerase/thioredoxin